MTSAEDQARVAAARRAAELVEANKVAAQRRQQMRVRTKEINQKNR